MKTTTFHTLIREHEIRIPLIQRDYAQGREDARSRRVRRDFLRALKEALTSEKPLHLDFIYGFDSHAQIVLEEIVVDAASGDSHAL